ncbi:MAG: hypothetical protein IKS43_04820 [Clostridia bacterium]|nr:hypothetical protein [Clostridia bacterium]
MSAARLVLALASVAACAAFGRLAVSEDRKKLSTTEAFSASLLEAERRIRIDRLPLTELAKAIADEAPESPLPQMLTLICEGRRDAACGLSSMLVPAAQTPAAELIRGMGRGDVSAETQRLALAVERIGAAACKAREQHEKSARLTNALSLMLGVGAALVIL